MLRPVFEEQFGEQLPNAISGEVIRDSHIEGRFEHVLYWTCEPVLF